MCVCVRVCVRVCVCTCVCVCVHVFQAKEKAQQNRNRVAQDKEKLQHQQRQEVGNAVLVPRPCPQRWGLGARLCSHSYNLWFCVQIIQALYHTLRTLNHCWVSSPCGVYGPK